MSASNRIQGIYVPNIVPLDSRGDINEPELRRYVDWLIEQGVHGLYPNGSTGEFLRYTVEERRRIIEIIMDQTAGRVPVLAGAAEANVRETIKACEYYASLGVRAVAIVSPYYYRLTPGAVYAYFKEIGRNTPVDVTLYNIPMFASPIDVPTVQRLSEECERVVAIKDSSGDVAHMQRLISAVRPNRPDFSFLTGWDPVLLTMIQLGCDGGTNATAGVVPELTRDLYEQTVAGRIDEARITQQKVQRLFDAMITGLDFPEGFRLGLKMRGIEPGPARQPLGIESSRELSRLWQTLPELLKECGIRAVG
jgi:dihydrodipicolinate synthase/N-acetylneuraminate lyase